MAKNYLVFNTVDQIYVTEKPVSSAKADKIMADFHNRFVGQGYYKTAQGERIDPSEVVLEKQYFPYTGKVIS